MQLLLSLKVTKQLQRELARAADREIGGILLGEHVKDDFFRVVEISVQRAGGSHSRFTRHPKEHEKQLERFLRRTGGDYRRFNYLGEWHSHPSFVPTPSMEDIQTMQSMAGDPDVGANFLLLLICRLDSGTTLELTATMFRADSTPLPVNVAYEEMGNSYAGGKLRRLVNRVFRIK
jgi:integrative and conjugative element protein (TIGR02256 family)